ncbi:MAG: hypothetical protein K0B09_04885 [Bacteroidales bacterium]|nr:hypothetical protein [Bacteroidales bacterium]
MKKVSALIFIASFILLLTLWLTGKVAFEAALFKEINPLQWLVSFAKTAVVLSAYIVGFFAMIVITFVDIVTSLIWKIEFPILHLIYDKFFLTFSKGWYWDQFHGIYLFISGTVLLILSLIILLIPDTRRNQRVPYNPASYAGQS